MHTATALQYRVLGPLEVLSDDHAVPLGGQQQCLLLSALLARANSVVSADTLVEVLWGDDPPAGDGSAQLAKSIYRLRSTLASAGAPECLTTRRPGYLLAVPSDGVDADQFASLLAEGQQLVRADAQAALEKLDKALALWRGPAWADVADHDFFRADAARLQELRAIAVEARADAMLALGRHEELVPQLEAVIRQYPLRERPRAQLMLALYRGGRQAEALSAYQSFRRYLSDELGLEPSADLRRMERDILEHRASVRLRPGAGPVLAAMTCPYKGLAAFGADDADYFAGRDQLVAELVARMAGDRFLAVVGPSGSGKSSVVAAGLLPALRAGALPGSRAWAYHVMRPGADPREALTSALSPGERMVLVVDQFEEIFTSGADASVRAAFVDALGRACADEDSRTSVVLVIRADYYGACAEHADLAKLLSRSQVLVPPMSESELRDAVLEPARRAGLSVEPGLVDRVVRDAAGVPGALPLVSTALLETWVRRAGTRLTLAGYTEAGGVSGAVGRVAEAVYNGLDPPGQAHARRILLRLADTEGDRVDVRRRAPQAELAATRAEREVLDTLISGRLLSASEDTVEVAHEALLREWPRLRRWLEEDREGRRLHRQLAQAAIVWDADLRDEADLYRGVRLHAVRDWLATHPDDPNALEQQFINASEAFDATSLRTARRTARRLRVLAASLAILLAAAVIGTWIAIDQRSSARRQALQADVNRLATSATTLSGEQHDLALLLGATAYELQPSDQDAGALQAALMNTPPGLDRIIRYPGPSTSPHLDASGHLLAIPGAGGVVIDNVDTGRQVTVLSWPTSRQYAVFSSDDRFVAAGGSDGTVAVWDAATGAPSGKPVVVGGGTVHAVFDPHDDNRLYVITSNGELTAWDRSDVRNPREVGPQFEGLSSFPAPGTAPDLTISADGRTIAAGGTDINDQPTARMWDTTTGATLHDYPGAVGGFAADNVTLPFGTLGSTVLLDARTGRVTKKIPGTSAAGAPTIGQDGTRLAVAGTHGSTSSVTIYDLASGQRIWHPVTLRSSEFYPLGFLPGGQLVTTGADEATVWTIGKDLPPLGVALDAGVQVSEELDYRFVLPIFVAGWRDVLTVGGGSAWRYDSESGALVGEVPFGVNAPSPDGRLMLDNDGKLWDDRSGKLLSLLKLPPPNVFSAHGYTFAGDESWDPTGHHVAADVGGTGYLWDVSNPQEPSAPRRIGDARLGAIQHLAFMPDGRILVESDGGARLSLIDASSNHTIWNRTISAIAASRRHPDRGTMAHGVVTLRQFAPSPDGSTLALDIGDLSRGRVILLDLSSGAVRGSLVQPTYGGVGYLNHGRWLLVTADAPRPTAQLYDATTLQPFGVPFPTDDVDQERVAVDPAGTRFAQMIEDEANPPLGDDPFLWSVDPARWLRTACAIAGRNLTRAEWHQYLPDRPYRTTCPALPAGS